MPVQTMKPRTTARTLIRRMHRERVDAQERALEKRRLANDVRDLRNWVAVFGAQYDLPADATQELQGRIDALGERLARI